MSDHSWQNGDWEDDGLTDDLDLGELADLLESDTPQRKSDVPLRVSEKAMNVPSVKDDKKVRPRRRSRLGNPPCCRRMLCPRMDFNRWMDLHRWRNRRRLNCRTTV